MSDNTAFTKLVPGFDFLQGLLQNAGSALPNMGSWVAPTLNPEELEKRIEELRTVQFWLEQNARMLGATIQALEVQRMTLSTLKTMNVQMADLRDSLKIKLPESAAPSEAETPAELESAAEKSAAKARRSTAPATGATATAPAGVVDPMQWWGALTKQFTQLAASALKDTTTDAAKGLAGATVKQSFDAAEQTLKKAVSAPMQAASKAATAAGVAAARTVGTAVGAAAGAAKPARKRSSARR